MSSILDSLRQIVNRHESTEDVHAMPRAAAVLLIEMAMTDAGGEEAERQLIERLMLENFDLDPAEFEELIAEAGRQQREAVSLHDYTHQLRSVMHADQRAELVGWLWRVAYADGRLDRHEEHLVRRLADLLGVPHREFIRQKHLAAD